MRRTRPLSRAKGNGAWPWGLGCALHAAGTCRGGGFTTRPVSEAESWTLTFATGVLWPCTWVGRALRPRAHAINNMVTTTRPREQHLPHTVPSLTAHSELCKEQLPRSLYRQGDRHRSEHLSGRGVPGRHLPQITWSARHHCFRRWAWGLSRQANCSNYSRNPEMLSTLEPENCLWPQRSHFVRP